MSVTICGPVGSLSPTCRVELRAPVASGEKAMLMVQVAPAGMLVPHPLLVMGKSFTLPL